MISERVPRQATANQKEHKGSSHICQKETSGWSPRPFRKISHGQKKVELFGRFAFSFICHKLNIKSISYQLLNMVVVMWWSEDASGPGQLAVNNGSKAAFLPENAESNVISSCPEGQVHLSYVAASYVAMICTRPNPSLKKKEKKKFDVDYVKTHIWLRCFGTTLNKPFMLENPPVWLNKKKL